MYYSKIDARNSKSENDQWQVRSIGYAEGINSQLVKGFIELAVIEARIEENIFSFRDSENFDYAYYNKRNNELSIQRTELLKRLNLGG